MCAKPFPLLELSLASTLETNTCMNPDAKLPPSPKPESGRQPVVAGHLVPKKIQILGVPLDLGQSRRGVDMGPSAVRVAGLEGRLEALGHVVEDGGNVSVAIAEQ